MRVNDKAIFATGAKISQLIPEKVRENLRFGFRDRGRLKEEIINFTHSLLLSERGQLTDRHGSLKEVLRALLKEIIRRGPPIQNRKLEVGEKLISGSSLKNTPLISII